MKTDIILRDYQQESFLFLKSDFEKLVLAMCPSSGKTETVIYYIDQLYKQNKNIKVLVLPHSTNVLLNNFYERLTQKNVEFSYSTDTSVDCNVHIILPQNNSKIKDQYDLLVVDEAHENYLAQRVQRIVNASKVKKQLLLTGTPSRFIKQGGFDIKAVAANTISDEYFAKLQIELVSSGYEITNEDYNDDENLRDNYTFTETDTEAT
jgi:superfamily II DNA or RNA helicase